MRTIKNIITVLMLVAGVQAIAQTTSDMQRLPSGTRYKIFTNNPGPKIKLNDVITFNFIQKTDKDSVLSNSFATKQPFTMPVQAARNAGDLMDFFPLLTQNDSAMVMIPTDSIFTSPEMQRPPFFPKGSSLVIILKIEKVQSMEEAMAAQQKIMSEMKEAEALTLTRYLTENKVNGVKTKSGLRYIVRKPSAKAKPVKGDTVLVNYTGRNLEGKVFDSSVEAESKKAGLQQPGRAYEPISVVLGAGSVIPGWEEGLLLLNEGSKATFIIPSELGYGPQGAGADIKPFSTLLFDLEVVKVKRNKKAASTTVKKPAAKPVAKKSTAKPAAKASPVKKASTTKKN
ncbi:MAG TPA: FKBP-type peptidyl-prolyl cis-trans isomerase [Pedobacter sp.]|jgi:FKBP-type peptidyl-prolyl cis-trans isomerase